MADDVARRPAVGRVTGAQPRLGQAGEELVQDAWRALEKVDRFLELRRLLLRVGHQAMVEPDRAILAGNDFNACHCHRLTAHLV